MPAALAAAAVAQQTALRATQADKPYLRGTCLCCPWVPVCVSLCMYEGVFVLVPSGRPRALSPSVLPSLPLSLSSSPSLSDCVLTPRLSLHRCVGPWLAEMLLLVAWGRDTAAALGAADTWSQPPPAAWLAPSDPPAAATGTTVAAELCRLLLAYIARFQCKQCCFSDIKPFLTLLAAGRGTTAVADAVKGFQTDVQQWVADADAALAALVAARAGTSAHTAASLSPRSLTHTLTLFSRSGRHGHGHGRGRGLRRGGARARCRRLMPPQQTRPGAISHPSAPID